MACLVKLMAAVLVRSSSPAVTGGIITWGNQHLCKVGIHHNNHGDRDIAEKCSF